MKCSERGGGGVGDGGGVILSDLSACKLVSIVCKRLPLSLTRPLSLSMPTATHCVGERRHSCVMSQ